MTSDNTNTGSCSAGEKKSCGTDNAAACGGGAKKCCGKTIAAALLGGFVMFAWISLSWMALPWHKSHFHGFADEAAMASAITANVKEGDGVYMVPFTNMGKTEQKTAKPYAFVMVREGGVDLKTSMPVSMAQDFALCVLLAGMLACVLRRTAGTGCPVSLSAKIGLMAGLAAYVPMAIWFFFPVGYTVVGIVETAVAFMLAGLAIARFVLKLPIGCSASACKCGKAGCAGNCGGGGCGTKA